MTRLTTTILATAALAFVSLGAPGCLSSEPAEETIHIQIIVDPVGGATAPTDEPSMPATPSSEESPSGLSSPSEPLV